MIESLIDVAITRAIGNERSAQRLEACIFGSEFAAYCNIGCCRAVSIGALALYLALLAVGVGPGDGVIKVSMNLVATSAAIIGVAGDSGNCLNMVSSLISENGVDRSQGETHSCYWRCGVYRLAHHRSAV
ncbi:MULTISPECIES: DegT/DnrJ/EryC1/StrS family aminotransferase [unclassified Bradyrhizobium]|uniref:DegT/DnrJ/EryC1/StrS family aminotransferase n=1 Tax=unclassified Bradyrhizobium TaxID=2631580 RepID=UPI001FFB0151|nr:MULTISPECIES: DegT/DnrJ/EryC1/StrS family aminotransferase [unclassified Bradyrhizobium]